MPIKKNTNQPEMPASLAHRLTAYSRQAKQYRNNPDKPRSSILPLPDWKKTSLAALIPLAAASVAQAQCQGGMAPTVLGPNQNFLVDVDGDGGNDIRFHGGPLSSFGYALQFWQVTAINPLFYIGVTSVGKARGAQDGFVVSRGQSFVAGPVDMCRSFGFGQFCFSYAARSVCVRKGDAVTGQPGWIRLYLDSRFGVGGQQFTITERGIEAITNATPNSAVVSNCSSIAAAPLPVEMTRFEVKTAGKNILLAWETAQELQNSGFEVQRSTDGQQFAKIGWVTGAGTSSTHKEYAFTDNEVQVNTLYYYRLRQLDHNGTEEFTPVRSASIKDVSHLTVAQLFPNPVRQGVANFRAEIPQEGDLHIQIFDARGGLVKQLNQSVSIGENTFSIHVSDLATGIYFVKMQIGKDVTYQQLVIN